MFKEINLRNHSSLHKLFYSLNLRDPDSKDVEVKPKESSNVDTNEQKENDVILATNSPASETNASSKPVQTVSPEQSADTTDVQPASDQVESAAANSNAPENDVSAASASTVLSKQPANADTQPTATTSGVQPFVNLAVESDNNDLTPKHETIDSKWTLHYVNQADHKQELKDPTVITMQYTRTNTPQSDGTVQYGDWSYVPGSFKLTGTPITVKDSNNPVKQDNVDKNGENFDVFTITAMYPTVAGYGFYNGINGTRLRDNLRNNERQADTMSKDFYAEYDVAKPTQETVGSQWRIHYIDSTNHEHELKAPTVINLQYARTNTPQSDGTIQHGDWSYVPGSFKLTGTPITVNDSNNPVKQDNVDKDGKNEDVFTIDAMYPIITGYNFHDAINNARLHDYLLNYDPNGNIQMPTMGQDFYVEYDPIGERSVAVKFVDDQFLKKQVGQAITLTGHDGDTVNLKLTVPDKYQLADGQQLPTTYTFAKGSGDLKIHLVHKVVQREATIDVQLLLTTSVHTSDNDYAVGTITQARWKQLVDENNDGVPSSSADAWLAVEPSVKAGTLTGHVDYDLVDERVTSLGDDWTTLNLGGKTYQLPNGDEVVNGIMIDSDDSWGKSFKEENLKFAQIEHVDLDPDYVNRSWHGYLSVNATNNDNNGLIDEVHSLGLQAGLVGDEPNALAKATGDRAATAVEMSNKPIDLDLLREYDFDFSEQNGQLRANVVLPLAGVYVPYVEKTATRTIKVTTPDGKTTTVVQTATLAKQIGSVEDVHLDWTTGEWANYTVPNVPGYTASQTNVAKEAVTGTTEDQTVNITYTANDGTQTIVYQDEDGSEIDKQVISGKTDEKVKVTPDVPDGYVLKGEVPSEVTIKPDDNPITVTVEHGKSHVTPDKPVNKGDLIPDTKDKHYPEGLTHNDLNKTITREVTITDPSGKKTTRKQTVTFTRDATVDEVTGKVTYGTWSENGKHIFDEVNVPYITGYRASEEVPEVTVIPDSESTKVNVTYVAKTYDVYIFYQKVSTIYDSDSSDGSDAIFYRKDFDKYANGKLGIAKPEVLRGHYGESINIPIKQVQGYHVDPYRNYSNYKFGMDAITGQELSWYDFDFNNSKDLKDPLPEDASEDEKENSMPRFIFVDYIKDYANSGYNNSGYNIGYVDTEGAVISRPTNLRGISGTDTNYTAPTFEGYTLTNPQEVPEKFDKTSKDIFLVYKPQDVKVTYHYVDETGKELVPSYVENNHFTGLTHVDQKDAKTIPGYSLVSTPEQTVVDGLKDLDLYFTYKANDGSQTISYQNNGQEVGKQVITGKTDQTVKVTPEVPDGYVVKSEIPKEVTIRAKDDAIVIVVEHGKAHISPDKPVNKGDLIEGTKDKHYPSGLTHDDLNKTITRKVTIIDPTGKKTITMQTVTFTRDATVDEVTGKVTYGNWSENGQHTFDKVEVPTISGYTANGDVPSIVVTPSSTSGLDKVVTYVANEGSQTIIYVDENGKKVGQQVVTGKTGDKVKLTPEIPSGYESNDKLPKEVTIKAKDEPLIVKVIEKIPEVNPDQNVTDDDSNKNINQESTPEQSSEDTSKDTESHEVKTDNKKNHTISVQEKHSDHKKLGEKLTVTTKSESKLRTATSKHLEKMSNSTLPQTGKSKDFLSIMGLVATALSGVFGFGLKKKKKE
ncbi:hypothetical protein CEE92_12135 [Lactobacillus crispatus]|uniref:mucin-binding protein n=1 Tax=Lactobacillus crispatus TaxID=47770 RepID=UPI0010DD766D|nr:MucBP domain-containing protein [Lactobacillus crispatus]TDM89855.1 hypothetical protein CEE92_12135 [Lactobacillus crispatus]